MVFGNINFGSLTLDGNSGANFITNFNARKVPGTLKQRTNEMVSFREIPGRAKEWQIDIEGYFSGGNRSADKTTLTGYDNGSIRNYSDGEHDGNYVIESLEFPRDPLKEKSIRTDYRLVIRQYTQTLP